MINIHGDNKVTWWCHAHFTDQIRTIINQIMVWGDQTVYFWKVNVSRALDHYFIKNTIRNASFHYSFRFKDAISHLDNIVGVLNLPKSSITIATLR